MKRKTPKVIATIKIQGYAHWHQPKQWNWPQFYTQSYWTIRDIDEDSGILTIQIHADTEENENGKQDK